jgi:hypothetical protein
MSELETVFSAFSFLLGLIVVGLLWWSSRAASPYRPFWIWVAAGWTLNWLGSLAWGIYEVLTGNELPLFSAIDSFYLGRYLLVWWAIWRFPQSLPGRRFSSAVLTMAAAVVLAWMAFEQSASTYEQPTLYLFAVATYPVLDSGMLYTLWLRLKRESTSSFAKPLSWFVAGIVAYSVANWINYLRLVDYAVSFSNLASMLWLACDVLVAVAAVIYVRSDRPAA